MKKYKSSLLLLIVCLFSCTNSKEQKIETLIKNWSEKELLFPTDWSQFVVTDSINKIHFDYAQYAIISYIDSNGCVDCRLNLPKWTAFIDTLNSVSECDVPVLFIFNPKDSQYLFRLLKRVHFSYPVCIDKEDRFNKLNHFPNNMDFQTFLINKEHKVMAIGNPILNRGIQDLYLNIIQNKRVDNKSDIKDNKTKIKTKVTVDKLALSFGNFDWQEKQTDTFTLKNTGNKPLVIENIRTSCGCTEVEYSTEPAMPGKEITLRVFYKANSTGFFRKTITVYCNTETSPLVLTINGEAKSYAKK